MPQDKKKREGPTWMNMGIEKEMILRLQKPLKKELNHLYKQVYRGLPARPSDTSSHFCASLGMDVIRDKYLPSSTNSTQAAPDSPDLHGESKT